jgi:hypothetical protein
MEKIKRISPGKPHYSAIAQGELFLTRQGKNETSLSGELSFSAFWQSDFISATRRQFF